MGSPKANKYIPAYKHLNYNIYLYPEFTHLYMTNSDDTLENATFIGPWVIRFGTYGKFGAERRKTAKILPPLELKKIDL